MHPHPWTFGPAFALNSHEGHDNDIHCKERHQKGQDAFGKHLEGSNC